MGTQSTWGHWSVEVALTMTSLLFGPWTASMMEDPAEREVAGEALIELQLARANAKRADWARPVKFDGFWKHPKANSKMAHNNEQHEFKSAQYKLPDTDQRIQYMKPASASGWFW